MAHWIAVRLSMEAFDMKKFIINILIFFGLVAVVDMAAGKVFWYLQSTRAGGGTGSEYYVCKDGNEDILIMGSSRASHHYVAKQIADSLGMSCYNGGQDGNGIIMQYGRWKMLEKHHTPKVIIYDVEPVFDLSINDNERYVDRLKPYSNDSEVKQYIAGLFPMERWKLFSQMYRYNYKFLEILSDCVRPSDISNGYKPLYQHIRQELVQAPKAASAKTMEVDGTKYRMLCKLVEEVQAKGSTIVFVSSPYWQSIATPDMSAIQAIADEYGIFFYDYSSSEISSNPDWFADSMHLNDEGASAFTDVIIGALKTIM